MTHPTMIAMLATDRHAELLREAEAYRRAAGARARTPRRVPGPRPVLARVRTAWAGFRRPSAQLCCA